MKKKRDKRIVAGSCSNAFFGAITRGHSKVLVLMIYDSLSCLNALIIEDWSVFACLFCFPPRREI